jgi:pimeloyl-ACP methyl ester carboxylesterase
VQVDFNPELAAATEEPLPSPQALAACDRAKYHGAGASDYLLRTALATIAAATAAPWALSGGWRSERRHLGFYAELAAAQDSALVFPEPERVDVEVGRRHRFGSGGGRVEDLSFRSTYVACNAAVRRAYAQHSRNGRAGAQHWRHPGAPAPTLLVIHGFGASPVWFNALFFSLRGVFAAGWDILLHTLPFHGARRGRLMPFNGAELFARGLAHLSEAILQGVHDARVLIAYLDELGAPQVGVTGLSLGGYTAALLASVDARLAFAVPNAPVSWLPPMLDGWFPANLTSVAVRRLAGISDDLIASALAVHSPLNYTPVLANDRLMIIAGLGDRLAPPEQARLLWEHWQRPQIHWFPGSHILHFGRSAYLTAMWQLMGIDAR